jgi:carboxyl-terminal processing protease
MTPEEFHAFSNQTSGQLVGVGIQLSLNPDTEQLTVVQPIADSPAMAANVQPGDLILQVDGEPTEGWTVEEAANRIRGEGRYGRRPATAARRCRPLYGHPDSRPHRCAGGAVRCHGRPLGSASATSAWASSTRSLLSRWKRRFKDLEDQQVEGYVLDLRNNPGGILSQAIAIARMWLNDGAIVRTVDRDGHDEEMLANRTALTDKPLVVLGQRATPPAPAKCSREPCRMTIGPRS